jgi:serine/threonine protein phosphatase PrpC
MASQKNEDRLSIRTKLNGDESIDYYGIFDGHAGHHVSDYLAEVLHQILVEYLELRGLKDQFPSVFQRTGSEVKKDRWQQEKSFDSVPKTLDDATNGEKDGEVEQEERKHRKNSRPTEKDQVKAEKGKGNEKEEKEQDQEIEKEKEKEKEKDKVKQKEKQKERQKEKEKEKEKEKKNETDEEKETEKGNEKRKEKKKGRRKKKEKSSSESFDFRVEKLNPYVYNNATKVCYHFI